MGPIAPLVWPKRYEKETESLQSYLSETKIPIGETELVRVSGYGYIKWTRWRRIDQIGGVSLTLGFGHMSKWESGWGLLEHLTKHFEQESH